MKSTVLDDIDVFDEIELSSEDKLLFSDKYREHIIETIKKEFLKYDLDKKMMNLVKQITSKNTLLEKKVSETSGAAHNELKTLTSKSIGELKNDSNEIKNAIKSIKQELTSLVLGEIAERKKEALETREASLRLKEASARLDAKIKESSSEVKGDVDKVKSFIETIKKEHEELIEKMKKKYDELRSDIMNQPQYTFGGYPPPGGGLPISTGGISDWRIIPVGVNLSIQKYENNVWVEKGSFLP